MHFESGRDTRSFLITLVVTFVVSCVVALPLLALGLGAPMVVILPLVVLVGALVASVVRWLMGLILNAPGQRPGFLPVLARGIGTAMLALIALPLLAMSGVLTLLSMSGIPLLLWVVPGMMSIAVVAYRVTAVR